MILFAVWQAQQVLTKLLRRPVHHIRDDYRQLAEIRFGGLPGAATVLIGDSHAQAAPVGELGGGIARRGIGGQTIADAASWLDLVLCDPQMRRLLVWAGTNNLGRGQAPEVMADEMCALLRQVQQDRPDVAVVVLGLPPQTPVAESEARAAEAALADAARQHGVPFRPIFDLLWPTWPENTDDGVHLSGRGYARLSAVLV